MNIKIVAGSALAILIAASVSGIAQTLNPPNAMRLAPAATQIATVSAVDFLALQKQVQQLEAAHQTTRTELAQARLELKNATASLSNTNGKLAKVKSAVRVFADCEKERVSQGIYSSVESCPAGNKTAYKETSSLAMANATYKNFIALQAALAAIPE